MKRAARILRHWRLTPSIVGAVFGLFTLGFWMASSIRQQYRSNILGSGLFWCIANKLKFWMNHSKSVLSQESGINCLANFLSTKTSLGMVFNDSFMRMRISSQVIQHCASIHRVCRFWLRILMHDIHWRVWKFGCARRRDSAALAADCKSKIQLQILLKKRILTAGDRWLGAFVYENSNFEKYNAAGRRRDLTRRMCYSTAARSASAGNATTAW
jgi:hypothetical protein